MNHCISSCCSLLLSVDGWNSLLIQRFAAAMSACAAGAESAKSASAVMVCFNFISILRLEREKTNAKL